MNRIVWAFKNPLKFLKKYLWSGFPTYPQLRWAFCNPRKFLTKYRSPKRIINYIQRNQFLHNRFRRNQEISKNINGEPVVFKESAPVLEHHFQSLCITLLPFLSKTYPAIQRNAPHRCVLVETRILPHTEFVIKNTILKLGDGWGHMIFCSPDNHDHITSICNTISPDIEIIVLDRPIATRNDYNNLMLDPWFWDQLPCDKVLIYQTDTFIFKSLDPLFLKYDYVGAPWGVTHTRHIANILGHEHLYGGNGGLSLRSVWAMKKILADHYHRTPDRYQFDVMDCIPEDAFFSMHMIGNTEFCFPSRQQSEEFAAETKIHHTAFGCHQPWVSFTTTNDLTDSLCKTYFQSGDKKRILYINHEESVTGAPRLFKTFIDYQIRRNTFDNWVISLDCKDDCWDLDQKIYYAEIPGVTTEEKANFISQYLHPDVTYANTIVSLDIAHRITGKKIISIHEFRSLYPVMTEASLNMMQVFDSIMVACHHSQKLLASYGIDSQVVPYYSIPEITYESVVKKSQRPIDRPYVLSMGYVQYRKGIHRFLEVARKLPEFDFVWAGSCDGVIFKGNTIHYDGFNFQDLDYQPGEPVEHFVRKDIVPDNVRFIGLINGQDLSDIWIRHAHAVVMLSTDDPFPLVVIDTKLMHKNVVISKECGDAYTLCDDHDLIMETYDAEAVTVYLRHVQPRPAVYNALLAERLHKNVAVQNDYLYRYLTQKIKVFTALDASSPESAFDMLDKMSHSLSRFPDCQLHIICNAYHSRLDRLKKRSQIIIYESRLKSTIQKKFSDRADIAGCYLRFEIPRICKERNYTDTHVVYCDIDTLWVRNPNGYLPRDKVAYIAAAPEFQKDGFHYFNSGVLWMNISGMLEKEHEFFAYAEKNMHIFKNHDQDAMNHTFKGMIDRLDIRLNWKPYWGRLSDAALIHFHWIKPTTPLTDPSLQKIITHNFTPGMIDQQSIAWYQLLWKKYKL